MHRDFLPAVVVGALANSRVSSAAKSSARCAGAAAVLIWLVAGAAANGQTGRGVAYDRTAVIQAICRQYVAAVTGMPTDLMFNQCMLERQCRGCLPTHRAISANRPGR
jgi:hypothetical protein